MPDLGNASSDRRKVFALVGIALLLTIASGVAYGHWTQRWGAPADLQAAGRRLRTLPAEIGEWRLVEESEMPVGVVRTLECAGYVSRTYVNQETGQSVQLAVIVGPPGPTAVHTPEICYSSRAYEIKQDPEKVALDRKGAESNSFWSMTFQSKTSGADPLRVYYAWSDGKKWTASDSPRFEFGGSRMLYKIQLAGLIDPNSRDNATDPCRNFLEALLGSEWSLKEMRAAPL